jgi:vancomycin resistance protein YoaR
MHMSATKTTKTTRTKTSAKAKPRKKAKATKPKAEEKMSALDAAAKVLGEKGTAMTCPELIGVMAAKGYWSSPGGKTPAATLYAAILREITTKGKDARFAKTAPGRFALRAA